MNNSRLQEDPLGQLESLVRSMEELVTTNLASAAAQTGEQSDMRRHQSAAAIDVRPILETLEHQLTSIKGELTRIRIQQVDAETQSRQLAKSQAEALVNSAEIILELEETRRRLTESHEAERQAKIDAQRLVSFGNILDESVNEIFFFDYETLRFAHVNQGARKNLGYSMDELKAMTPLDLKPEFNRQTFEQTLAPLRESTTDSVHFATIHRRKNGTRYPIEVHLHRSVFEDRPVFVAMILDATRKKQAEEEIRKLSSTVEQSPASVVIADIEGKIEYVNPKFIRVTGVSREDAVVQNARELLGSRLVGYSYDEVWSAVQTGEIWCGEIESYAPTGERTWESVSISPIRNANGKITHFLATFQDVSDYKELLEQMQHLAFHDSLTGLPNRTSLLQTVQKAIDNNDGKRFALLFLDFDRFKLINDSLGHKTGDELLRQISDRLRRCLRSTDSVVAARLGGDEFVVFLNDLKNWGAASSVAERLLRTFSASYQLCGNTVHSTVSIGIVTNEYGCRSANDMLRDADLAMYEAKSKGKGGYVVFDQSLHRRAETRLQIECDLRKAILRDELLLYYQPIVSLESGKLSGFETLVRWQHPERGMVSPDDFIPVAEETRLIIPIGERILDEACRQFKCWQSTLGDSAPKYFHVNVSRLQMLLPNLVKIVADCLKEHDVPAPCLHLEITESIIVQDTRTIVNAMNALRDIGVKIDMDDFGTGYSSLSCLHEFPIDVIKIDRSFINTTRDVQEYVALLNAILALADNLNLEVVAEGLETLEQLATLQAMGCEYGQGFLFSHPLPADEFEAYATSERLPLMINS